MKRQVGSSHRRAPEILEHLLLERHRASDHMNLQRRESVGELENAVGSLRAPDVADPEHIDVACDGRRRLLDQHSRHATRQSVVTPHGARLRSGLHEDGIGSPQSVCIEPAVARESYEQARRVAVRVTGGAEHESLAETATEQRDQAYVHTRATRVIDVGVRAR